MGDPIWARYAAIYGDQESFQWYRESNDQPALVARIASFLAFLARRPEQSIAVVSHSAFLSYVFNGTDGLCAFADNQLAEKLRAPWANCELRTVAADFLIG